MSEYATVKYRYYRGGTGAKIGGAWSGTVASRSESLILAELNKRHRGYEIEIRQIKWKSDQRNP